MRLQETAAELGIAERLVVIGQVARREQLMKICAASDVGLSLLPNHSDDVNVVDMAGASNKVFEYMACGLAVIVPDQPVWRELFVDTGYGLACDSSDAAGIAAAIQRFCDDPVAMRTMGECGRRRIVSEWNYERQFQPVLDVLCGQKRVATRTQAVI